MWIKCVHLPFNCGDFICFLKTVVYVCLYMLIVISAITFHKIRGHRFFKSEAIKEGQQGHQEDPELLLKIFELCFKI